MAALDFLQPLANELPRGVSWLRSLPWPASAALLGLGLLGLVLGARYRRGVSAVGGFAAGALAALTLLAPAMKSASLGPAAAALLCGAVIAAASFAVPWVFPFTLGAAIGAPLGARLPVGVPVLGPALGAVAVGGVMVIGSKIVAASAAGLLGGGMVMAGVLSLTDEIPLLGPLAAHPMVALGLALVLGVAGTAAQVDAAWEDRAPAKKARKPALEQPATPRDS